MINNLQTILPLLNFEEEGDFYQLYIFVRKKDMTTNKSNHQSARTIKTYTIRSKEYLEERFNEIQLLCETFKARAYINLNRMNDADVALKMIEKLVHCLQNKTTNVKGVYDSVVGNLPSKEKRWVVDLDKEHLEYKSYITDIINICQPIGNKIITEIPTKNGVHLITHPFNVKEFENKVEKKIILSIPDIQKNNPTLLYVPRALYTDHSLIDIIKLYEQTIIFYVGKDNWKEWVEQGLFYQNEISSEYFQNYINEKN